MHLVRFLDVGIVLQGQVMPRLQDLLLVDDFLLLKLNVLLKFKENRLVQELLVERNIFVNVLRAPCAALVTLLGNGLVHDFVEYLPFLGVLLGVRHFYPLVLQITLTSS